MRRAPWVLAMLGLSAGAALAHPEPPPEPPPARPGLEWSTWLRLGYGGAPHSTQLARLVVGPPSSTDPDRNHGWETAFGIDLTFAVGRGGDLRLGPFAEASTTGTAMVGGELVVAAVPAKLDMFWYEGEGVLVARAGTDGQRVSGAVAYGYRAPWNLFRPQRGASRYMIGVRLVATYTRDLDDPRQWSSTVGLETEPVGALRYLLGIRSWY